MAIYLQVRSAKQHKTGKRQRKKKIQAVLCVYFFEVRSDFNPRASGYFSVTISLYIPFWLGFNFNPFSFNVVLPVNLHSILVRFQLMTGGWKISGALIYIPFWLDFNQYLLYTFPSLAAIYIPFWLDFNENKVLNSIQHH